MPIALKVSSDLPTPTTMQEVQQEFVAPGATEPLRLSGLICVQVTGTASGVVFAVERSTREPGVNRWAPADDLPSSGSLRTGISPQRYEEPGRGWWRVRIISITGGMADVHMVGREG